MESRKILDRVALQHNLTGQQLRVILLDTFDEIKREVAKGNTIHIRGLLQFKPYQRRVIFKNLSSKQISGEHQRLEMKVVLGKKMKIIDKLPSKN